MFSWMNPKLEVRNTEKCGKGVFAKLKINKDDVLAVFGGYIIKGIEVQDNSFYDSDYSLQISEDFLIGSMNKKDVTDTDFFNHSCNPNAGFKGQIFLVAMRDIDVDDEILFDYAMVLQEMIGVKPYQLKCLCGQEECRGDITENDWKNEKLQNKYDGYFQTFIQEKINKLKKQK
ncbi:MAG: Nuclear protein SET [Candidatus Moranbacteria bacterium GW2011_GWF2_34_56]|nr:MAG: Nuclear protein SET [Candidatus Moranbacteria bacterium GW2011_GWF1_34_10]KKP65368.1 MAG: Nuclear protein SET [Candidatus Moranbacteria bacterium GW2011_GWF2_34_56]